MNSFRRIQLSSLYWTTSEYIPLRSGFWPFPDPVSPITRLPPPRTPKNKLFDVAAFMWKTQSLINSRRNCIRFLKPGSFNLSFTISHLIYIKFTIIPNFKDQLQATEVRGHALHGARNELLHSRVWAHSLQENELLHHHILPPVRPICGNILGQLPDQPWGDSREDDYARNTVPRSHQHPQHHPDKLSKGQY